MRAELYSWLEVRSRGYAVRGAREQPRTAYRAPSGYRILLGDVAARRLRHHPKLVQPHHGVVAHLELQAGLLLELAQEVGLLLHQIQRHVGMQPHRQVALLVLRPGALERTLHAPDHDLGPEHASGAVAGDRKSVV